MNIFKKIFGDESEKTIKKTKPTVLKINELEETFKKLSDEECRNKTEDFKKRLKNGETIDDILPEAFALVRESAKRTLQQRHYDVQLIGGIILHQGMIAEMRTGEGKTLVATLPAYLNALEEKGVHIVTVNDYLARRDTQWMGQIFSFLGLSVGVINDQNQSYIYDSGHKDIDEDRDELGSFRVFYEFLKPSTKKEAYLADITYGTNSQFGFDYLRDHTQQAKELVTQRGHNYVIIDEIDSILIDEARVPLILSTQAKDAGDLYKTMNSLAGMLNLDEDYELDEKLRAITINDSGISKAEKALKVDNLYTEENIHFVHHLETAVRAKALFLRDRDYVVNDNQVIIVDQFTGRMQEGRRYSDGLHQALEAKENVQIQQESKTTASITYQNYFKFYKKLSGMTGTARTSAEEFTKVYHLDVVEIPTNVPIARIDNVDLIFQTEMAKFKAIAKKIKEVNEKGQPILIGTVSVEKNELLSQFLKQEGVNHEILNAKKHEQEGEIIAQAGKKSGVTIATNMAGRGVDIKLGGNPCSKGEEEEIRKLGGLFVLGTERHDARRTDDQLRGRTGRQGDKGETQFYVSLEDSLMRIFGGDRMKKVLSGLGLTEDEAIQNKWIAKNLEKAQGKIEGFNFDSRKNILDFDNVISKQRNTVYERRQNILFDNEEYISELYEKVISAGENTEKTFNFIKNEIGKDDFINLFKKISLYVMDMLWMEHLEVMDNTRQSVNLRAYGQRDPIVEYKKEGLRLYREMEDTVYLRIANAISRLDIKSIKKEKEDRKNIDNQSSNNNEEDKETESPLLRGVRGVLKKEKKDKVVIFKKGEQKIIKAKKLQSFLDAGWEEVK